MGKCPQSLGHEWAGTVVETGKDVTKIKPGDRVTVLPSSLSGFAEYAVESETNCFKLVPEVNIMHALGEPLKCVITVLKGTAPEAGDNGIILGCGPMGLRCIQSHSGNLMSSLIAVDVDEGKIKIICGGNYAKLI